MRSSRSTLLALSKFWNSCRVGGGYVKASRKPGAGPPCRAPARGPPRPRLPGPPQPRHAARPPAARAGCARHAPAPHAIATPRARGRRRPAAQARPRPLARSRPRPAARAPCRAPRPARRVAPSPLSTYRRRLCLRQAFRQFSWLPDGGLGRTRNGKKAVDDGRACEIKNRCQRRRAGCARGCRSAGRHGHCRWAAVAARAPCACSDSLLFNWSTVVACLLRTGCPSVRGTVARQPLGPGRPLELGAFPFMFSSSCLLVCPRVSSGCFASGGVALLRAQNASSAARRGNRC